MMDKLKLYRHIVWCRFCQWVWGGRLFIYNSHYHMVCRKCKIKSHDVPHRWRTD